MGRSCVWMLASFTLYGATGCATQKASHTARTGVEQLLISSAVDRSLDNVDFTALRGKKVFLETKYLDCVDKNYIIVSMRQRILAQRGKLMDKADQADTVVEVSSGGVGTDSQELFVGIPEIPLPPPSPIAIPRLAFMTRTKLNGTAKLLVNAYDVKTKAPIFPSGLTMARSDQNNWNFLGMGNVQTGSVSREVAAATKEADLSVTTAFNYATGAYDAAPAAYLTNNKGEKVILRSDYRQAPR
ncbi:MAG: hypothetical protein HYX68_03030 [Planctomycetes bacterium]|nr:hypothetical protein [Planctomycetota bacterium]